MCISGDASGPGRLIISGLYLPIEITLGGRCVDAIISLIEHVF
jgi:hypothetical protein